MEIYEVGGHVRDSLMNVESHDIDYAVEAESFEAMKTFIESISKKIFLVKEEYLTIRALNQDNKAVDYVMCRSDGVYSDGRRPDSVKPGTIYDDLARRDFRMNAIARNVRTGELIDPYNGQSDIEKQLIQCVGITKDRLTEDPLRILRAIRFSITLGFWPNEELETILYESYWSKYWVKRVIETVSNERIQTELDKCFRYSTIDSLALFREIDSSWLGLFTNIWLKPTNEKR